MSNEKVSDAEVLEAMGITTSKNEENPEDVPSNSEIFKKKESSQLTEEDQELNMTTD